MVPASCAPKHFSSGARRISANSLRLPRRSCLASAISPIVTVAPSSEQSRRYGRLPPLVIGAITTESWNIGGILRGARPWTAGLENAETAGAHGAVANIKHGDHRDLETRRQPEPPKARALRAASARARSQREKEDRWHRSDDSAHPGRAGPDRGRSGARSTDRRARLWRAPHRHGPEHPRADRPPRRQQALGRRRRAVQPPPAPGARWSRGSTSTHGRSKSNLRA